MELKEKMDEVKKFLDKKEKISRLDLILYVLIALFSGIIIGFLTNPRRKPPRYIGCFNGNFNGGNYGLGDEEESGCEDGLCGAENGGERCCGETEYCGQDECCGEAE